MHFGQCTYVVDPTATNDNNDKIRSLCFAPCRKPINEGHYLWAGMQDGTLMLLNTESRAVLRKRSGMHAASISFILRHKNTEIWTLDDNGLLNIWPALVVDYEHQDVLDITPQRYHVTSRAVAVLKVGHTLFMSTGRTIDVHRVPVSLHSPHMRISNDLRNITQLAMIPYHPQRIFASHDDGKISVWDSETVERLHVITVSMYGISSMVSVGDYYLWTGYNTGMVYVYDTRPEKWVVVKMWKAHAGAVISLVVDDSGLIQDDGILQVVSADANGSVAFWDGLLTENWQDQQLQTHVRDYCTYREAQVMICSWNIDATKPDKLSGSEDDIKIHEWLHGMEDPDIIVVGIQEIVDLESKKQTARSLFASRKKIETLQAADELLTHRYSLWHDYLVQVIAKNYGPNAYTVVKTDQLVGLFSCIFVKTSEENRVFDCHSTLVKTGMKVMNKSLHGNKGGIAIRFLFDHTSLCFVNCHLAAGQSHIQQRNADAEGILQTNAFPEHNDYYDVFVNGGDGSLVLDHEDCFLSGDLNYRIGMRRDKVLELLASSEKQTAWNTLQIEDQLMKQRITNPLFKLLAFQEAPIRFDPTYKYDPGTDFYDRSEKKRVPAWCDRVLYRGKTIRNVYYKRHEVRASDHRPISAGFNFEVKLINDTKRDEIQRRILARWSIHFEAIIKNKKVQYIADYDACTLDTARKRLEEAHWDVRQTIMDLFA
ncbi:Endonuclease/exonuclease/phosphatase [Spinellus fusiger]|nr:Endonuclease/exonuclease/phosphatase [Spinellus fusiger]